MKSLEQLPENLKKWVVNEIKAGVASLASASCFERITPTGSHQYAINIETLNNRGLTSSGIRWMMENQFVVHLKETSNEHDCQRFFREGGVVFDQSSCFDLTDLGVEFSESIPNTDSTEMISKMFSTSRSGSDLSIQDCGKHVSSGNRMSLEKPVWDADRCELWYGDQLVKRYRLPSPNQIAIISTFEEDGWPVRIDDPLTQNSETTPKRRLQDTIRNLNRSMKAEVIKFLGDGSGEGILWESRKLSPSHAE